MTFERNSLRSTRHQTALEIGFFLNSDEFRMILRARLFGKGCALLFFYFEFLMSVNFRVGMDVDVAMEKLYICGKLAVTFTVDLDSPFPHVSNVSICFVEKPEVWFSIRMLKVEIFPLFFCENNCNLVFLDAANDGSAHFKNLAALGGS